MTKKSDRIYFTKETERAIVRYNNTDDWTEKNKIYKEHIEHPFNKIAENVLNTFKFSYFDVPKEDVQQEVVSMLVQKMHMYKAEKGKAFSYFSIIAKNYLILNNNSNYKRYKNTALISEMPESWSPENGFHEEIRGDEYQEFKNLFLEYWEKNLSVVFFKKRDIQIADAVLELIRRSQYIENFNKKHLYLLIREMTDCKTHYITKVVNIMREHHKELLEQYLREGRISDNPNEFFSFDE